MGWICVVEENWISGDWWTGNCRMCGLIGGLKILSCVAIDNLILV